jgi:hypothetical protein
VSQRDEMIVLSEVVHHSTIRLINPKASLNA